jgi:hypothetical protein
VKITELTQDWTPIEICDDNGDPPDSKETGQKEEAASQRN